MASDDYVIFADAGDLPVLRRPQAAVADIVVRGVPQEKLSGRPLERAPTPQVAAVRIRAATVQAQDSRFDLGAGSLEDAAWLRQHAKITGKKASAILLSLVKAYRKRVDGGPNAA